VSRAGGAARADAAASRRAAALAGRGRVLVAIASRCCVCVERDGAQKAGASGAGGVQQQRCSPAAVEWACKAAPLLGTCMSEGRSCGGDGG